MFKYVYIMLQITMRAALNHVKMGVLAIGMHISTFAIASLVTQDGLAVVGNWVLNDLLYVAFA